MKTKIINSITTKIIILTGAINLMLFGLPSCDDFLDQEPRTTIAPEQYLREESQLASYANGLYTNILPNGVFITNDAHTDNQAANSFSSKYVPGEWKVGQTDGSNWNFSRIYDCNYFLEQVLPRFEAGTITGSPDNIRHYIGEVYFMRAFEYFKRYQVFGDFPVISKTLPDEMGALTEASKRFPRNEVARFILSDLDKAIDLMSANIDSRKTRINKESALLIKSRVALYEGTFLKYFKGSAFVPGGQGWPGATKDYNQGYAYPTGSIDAEINWFLDQAIDAARIIGEQVVLTENAGNVRQYAADPVNPYMEMYASLNPSGYKEVLLWREYNRGLGVTHGACAAAQFGNNYVGLTRGYVESFLMGNGLPIYASGSGYHGDDSITTVRTDRDNRLYLFLKEPGQKNVFGSGSGGDANPTEQYPNLVNTDVTRGYNTGYAIRKGNSLDGEQLSSGMSSGNYTGLVIFRGVEALLNYIEAYYERNGSLDATATKYWQDIRTRAKVDVDFSKTINATEMTKEALIDWGAYSAGQVIDPTLYNIRRERRSEFIGEGMRWTDIQRWRSLDQLVTTSYHIEGFKLWGPMQHWYDNAAGNTLLVHGLDNPRANVSPPDRSEYIRPYEKARGSLVLEGYRWKLAHYLNPIAIQDMLITSKDNDLATSPIYQNPGWPSVANEGAIQ